MAKIAIVKIGYQCIAIKNWKEFMGELERGQVLDTVYGELGGMIYQFAMEPEVNLEVQFVDERFIFKGTEAEFRAAKDKEKADAEARATPIDVAAVEVREVPQIGNNQEPHNDIDPI